MIGLGAEKNRASQAFGVTRRVHSLAALWPILSPPLTASGPSPICTRHPARRFQGRMIQLERVVLSRPRMESFATPEVKKSALIYELPNSLELASNHAKSRNPKSKFDF